MQMVGPTQKNWTQCMTTTYISVSQIHSRNPIKGCRNVTKGLFWRDILKVAKNFPGPEMPLSTFWCGKYDVTSQERSLLLSFPSVKKQNTSPGGSEKEVNNLLHFPTNQRRASTNTRATSSSAPL